MTATATQPKNDFKYSLDEPIGQGIFSTTYQALEVTYESPVIIKTLAASLQDHEQYPQFTRQFLRLCDRLIDIPHAHLPQIWEYFEEEGAPYIVYDRILGRTLAEQVKTDGQVSEHQALLWLEQVASAVTTLHQAGLKHLDIHPRNIMIRQDSREAVLVDFGLTCELTPEIRQTHANLIAPGYAAIEQYDPRSESSFATDIYALSATLYFMLTGNAPPPVPLLGHIPAEKWQQFPEEMSPRLRRAILEGLSIEAQDRPQTVVDWWALLYPPQKPAPPKPVDFAPTSSPRAEDAPESYVSEPPIANPQLPQVPPRPSQPEQKPLDELERPSQTASDQTPPQCPLPPKTPAPKRPSRKPQKPRFPVGALLMTSAIAASAGAGFGLSLRLNRPNEPGATFWHVEQSFPPKDQ
ncbi:protein kinase [Spirulina sp. CS-785/01]|uniref:serine/threonine protein kinase n=1 Tax=Spirulina sp. CS-785/01 TaxID=3021716 RepID=UPI00232CD07F|nr:serine/threonine protein kinase [Spirulina sp. CS-785/01]MDB9314673.1 protein kinase [Spirulina sp. CS-785/01]